MVRMKELGLTENFRRTHPGQGTSNACFCFDNAYIEILWRHGKAEDRPEIRRLNFARRANWRQTGASPFGIALRGDSPFPFPSWEYQPPFLPKDISLKVAQASDDPAQPFVFSSPGNSAPKVWQDGRAGTRQKAAGLREIADVELAVVGGSHSPFQALSQAGIRIVPSGSPAVTLSLTQGEAEAPRRLRLPDFTLL